ncbi:MAG: hypothetical protein MI723_06195, partial [Caulobacterales bacterium]|nr:hypothetical protein [Caulobacterales bacterium]
MRHLSCVAAALLLAAPAAWAQETPDLETLDVPSADTPPERPRQRGRGFEGLKVVRPAGLLFATFDRDGDYAISRTEISEGLARTYPDIDANGDGRSTLLEYADWAKRALGARDARPGRVAVDPDLDGVVTPAEFFQAFEGQATSYGLTEETPLPLAELLRKVEPPAGREAAERSPWGGGRGG